jgi:hypothetical protein
VGVNRDQDEQADATAPEVGAYVERKYTASRPPVRRVVVMGKWTVAGWVGWLILRFGSAQLAFTG